MSRGRQIDLVCSRCSVPFRRSVTDAKRTSAPFCSKDCHSASMRGGRRRVMVTCSGCGVSFGKLPSEVNRCRPGAKHFCTARCYQANNNFRALGRLGGFVPRNVPRLARFLRSQRGGLARARNLSPERLREIALLGVAARLSKGVGRGPYRSFRRRAVQIRLGFVGPLLVAERAEE